MSLILFILTVITMLAVVCVLGLGVFSLAKGGEFREKWSNKLMRLRVALQAVAIVLVIALAWAFHNGL